MGILNVTDMRETYSRGCTASGSLHNSRSAATAPLPRQPPNAQSVPPALPGPAPYNESRVVGQCEILGRVYPGASALSFRLSNSWPPGCDRFSECNTCLTIFTSFSATKGF